MPCSTHPLHVPGEFNIGRLLRRLAHAAPGLSAVRLQIWLHEGLVRFRGMAAEPPLFAAEARDRVGEYQAARRLRGSSAATRPSVPYELAHNIAGN